MSVNLAILLFISLCAVPAQRENWKALKNKTYKLAHQSKYLDARVLARKAVTAARESFSPDDVRLADCLSNLAAVDIQLGDYSEADDSIKEAISIRERANRTQNPAFVICLNLLSLLRQLQGENDELTEQIGQRAMAIAEKGHVDSYVFGNALNQLGNLYANQRRFRDAEAIYERALRLKHRLFLHDPKLLAVTYYNLAHLYAVQGEYSKAEPLFQQVVKIEQDLSPHDDRSLATAIYALGVCERLLGQDSSAGLLLNRALSMRRTALTGHHPDVAQTLEAIADLRRTRHEIDEADKLYSEAFGIIFDRFEYSFEYMTERERLQLAGQLENAFFKYFSFVEQFSAEKPSVIATMYDLVLRRKGMVAESMASLRDRILSEHNPASMASLSRLASLEERLAQVFAAEAGPKGHTDSEIAELESQIDGEEGKLVRSSAVTALGSPRLTATTWKDV